MNPDPPSIRVAAVQLWSTIDHTPDDNRRHAMEMLEKAAAHRPDLVVLPEAVNMLCYPDGRPGFTYRDVAEPVPGPTTENAARVARDFQTNVVLGLIDGPRSDGTCQNSAVIIDRSGTIIGRYDKTHEPEVCRTGQAAATGSSLPVFELDFGSIGVFICWDLLAPEVASVLAARGARLLCFPHLISFPAPVNVPLQMRARALDNVVPLVAAGMRDPHNHNGSQDGIFPTCVIDADGRVVAQSERSASDIVLADVNLASPLVDFLGRNERGIEWRMQRLREIRVELYAEEYSKLKSLKEVNP